MTERKEADRRRAPRYPLNTEVFLVFRPDFSTLGKLKDVSSGGVSFEYAVFDEHRKAVDVEVDIFASEASNFMLRRVPCTVIYDTKIEQPSLGGIETRRCGLKFEQLSYQHCELLKVLVNNFASHRLPAGYAVNSPAASSL